MKKVEYKIKHKIIEEKDYLSFIIFHLVWIFIVCIFGFLLSGITYFMMNLLLEEYAMYPAFILFVVYVTHSYFEYKPESLDDLTTKKVIHVLERK